MALLALTTLAVTLVVVADDPEQSGVTAGSPPVTQVAPPAARYDGGPEEGAADVGRAPAARYDGGPEEGAAELAPSRASASVATEVSRYDGGPEEGTRGPAGPGSSAGGDQPGPTPFGGSR